MEIEAEILLEIEALGLWEADMLLEIEADGLWLAEMLAEIEGDVPLGEIEALGL